MVAYSFQKMFAEDIRFGFKVHTVRGERKRHARPGEMIQLYSGLRTKQCRKIVEDRKVQAVEPITLRFEQPCRVVEVVIGGEQRDPDGFAKFDGFDGWKFRLPGKWFADEQSRWTNEPAECMGAFWRYSQKAFVPTWSGWIIEWEYRGIISSGSAYEKEFGEIIDPQRYRWFAYTLGWITGNPETIDGLPPDLPDLGVRA